MTNIMKNSLKYMGILAIAALILSNRTGMAIAITTDGADTSGASQNVVVVDPVTTDDSDVNGGMGEDSSLPPTTDDADTSGVINNQKTDFPPTDDANMSGGMDNTDNQTVPPTDDSGTNGGQNGGGSTTNNDTGNTSGGGTSVVIGGGGASPSSLGGISVTTPSISTCPLITSYLRLGANNDSTQVLKLQAFLKTSEKLDVDMTGVFDAKTDAAVRAFQAKYLDTVMGPWDATRTTGFVYITTSKKINEIACNKSFTLSAEDLSVIQSYKNSHNLNGSEVSVTPSTENASSTSATSTDEIGQNDNSSNAAAVGNASILKRFWDFILNLFR